MEIHSEPVILYVISKTLKFIKHIMKFKSLAQVESRISIELSANSRAGCLFCAFASFWINHGLWHETAAEPWQSHFSWECNPSLAGGRCWCWKCGRKLTMTCRYFPRTFMGLFYLYSNKGFLLMWLLSGT